MPRRPTRHCARLRTPDLVPLISGRRGKRLTPCAKIPYRAFSLAPLSIGHYALAMKINAQRLYGASRLEKFLPHHGQSLSTKVGYISVIVLTRSSNMSRWYSWVEYLGLIKYVKCTEEPISESSFSVQATDFLSRTAGLVLFSLNISLSTFLWKQLSNCFGKVIEY